MILGIGFLLMVSLAFSAGVAALSKWWDALFQGWSTVAFIINLAASLILSTAVFAMIYKLMPRVQIDWRDVWIGAVVTALLFITGKFLIGLAQLVVLLQSCKGAKLGDKSVESVIVQPSLKPVAQQRSERLTLAHSVQHPFRAVHPI